MQTTFAPKIALEKLANSTTGIENDSSRLQDIEGSQPAIAEAKDHEALAHTIHEKETAGREALKKTGGEDKGSVAKQNLNALDRAKGTNTPFGPWAVENLNIGGMVGGMAGAGETKAPRPELGESWSAILATIANGEEPSTEQANAFANEVKLEIAGKFKGASPEKLDAVAGLIAAVMINGATQYAAGLRDVAIRNIR